MTDIKLPRGFELGTASAAFQVEGATETDGRGPSIWDEFVKTRGRPGDDGSIAADHYHRWAEDVALLGDLGAPTYRFSTSWSRVMPDGVTVNDKGLDFYDRLVDAVLEVGVQPDVTIYHMDLPSAFDSVGGWSGRDVVQRFADYADVLAARLGDRVGRWFTVNEPLYEAWLGYYEQRFPPGVVDEHAAVAALHHLLLGHGVAYDAVKAHQPEAQIGPVIGFAPTLSATDDARDVELAATVHAHTNRASLDPVALGTYPDAYREHPRRAGILDAVIRDGDLEQMHRYDFLGINYYFPRIVLSKDRIDDVEVAARFHTRGNRAHFAHLAHLGAVDLRRQTGQETVAGWTPYPTGLTDSLLELTQRYDRPTIYVTENGLPLSDYTTPDGAVVDDQRIAFIGDHLVAIAAAVDQGADVRGYYHWSLTDNLEWDNGFGQRFGLVHIDFATQRRTPKKSFHWYADIARSLRS